MKKNIKEYGVINVLKNRPKLYFLVIQNLLINSLIIFTIYYYIVEKGEYIILLFVPISFIGFVQIFEAIRKLSSDKPAFTLLKEKIVVYDNSKYSEIYYSDMVKCRIGRNRYRVLIIELKIDKNILHRKINKKRKKQTINLSLRYVGLNAKSLERVINYRISKNAQ